MSKTPHKREAFIEDLSHFIHTYHLDGIELNWQFPSSTDELQALGTLAKEIKHSFPKLLLSIASPPSIPFFQALLAVQEHFDIFHIMFYLDLNLDVATTLKILMQWYPSSKLTAGIPFFLSAESGTKSYEEAILLGGDQPSQQAFWNVAKRTIDAVKSANLAGVSIWEIGQDCRPRPVPTHPVTCPDPSQSLLYRIYQELE